MPYSQIENTLNRLSWEESWPGVPLLGDVTVAGSQGLPAGVQWSAGRLEEIEASWSALDHPATEGTLVLRAHPKPLDDRSSVIVRPMILTNEPWTNDYRADVDLKPGRRPYISRADVADFLLKQLTDDTFVHQTPAIGY